jgi:hypothetical protein
MGFSVSLDEGRTACVDSIDSFIHAVESFSEYDLLGGSRCHGWTRLDVTVHVLAGWQEMLGGMVSSVDSEPTVDAATYWPAFTAAYAADDSVPTLMAQRRRAAAYERPESARSQLRDVGAAVRRGVISSRDRRYLWQEHVFAAGDFLAIWAVEDAVHHLDLLSVEPAPATALKLARSTIEALIEQPLPATMSDEEATLIGTGRSRAPAGLDGVVARLPALG